MRDWTNVSISSTDVFGVILPDGHRADFHRKQLVALRSKIDDALNTSQEELDESRRVSAEYAEHHPHPGASVPVGEAQEIAAQGEKLDMEDEAERSRLSNNLLAELAK